MLKKKYIILINIIIVLIFFLIFILHFGRKYIYRLNTFIYENNNIIIKNEINDFITHINTLDYKNIYDFKYNDKEEVVGATYNVNFINDYLKSYIDDFKKNINNDLYSKYLSKYFKKLKINNRTYLRVPLGIIYENPFIYNFGPDLFLSYDYITSYNFKIDFDAKNYGLNNILVNIYLVVKIDQSIFKPVLKTVNSNEYRFLLSSQLVYGRVSNFLTSGINMQSDNL